MEKYFFIFLYRLYDTGCADQPSLLPHHGIHSVKLFITSFWLGEESERPAATDDVNSFLQ